MVEITMVSLIEASNLSYTTTIGTLCTKEAKLIQFCHSRDIKTAGHYYDKYKDFKFILAASVLFKLSKLAPKTILKKFLDTLCEKVAISQL